MAQLLIPPIPAISNMVASYLEDNQLAEVMYYDGYFIISNWLNDPPKMVHRSTKGRKTVEI